MAVRFLPVRAPASVDGAALRRLRTVLPGAAGAAVEDSAVPAETAVPAESTLPPIPTVPAQSPEPFVTDPGRRGLGAVAGLAMVAALAGGALFWRARPVEVAAPPARMDSAAASAGPAEVVVDVAGRVRRPGLVRLPFGSRVADALRAAGGPLPGASTTGLNLARRLADGEQVLVGVVPAAGSPPAAGAGPGTGTSGAAGSSAAGSGVRLDLNTASQSDLEQLPGVGPVLAERIIEWRTQHGRFASVEQLREVSGIGERKFASLRDRVTA